MIKPTQPKSRAFVPVLLCAALAACLNQAQAQVTFEQVTNGLVSYYPLDDVVPVGTALTTPDHVGGRDLILSPATTAANLIPSTRPTLNSEGVTNAFNLAQVGGATVLYYDSKGQDPLTGEGDFLPFCNQINATMSFWIKANDTTGRNDSRFFGECDTTGGNAGPIWLIGTSSGGGLDADKQAHFLLRQKASSPGVDEPDPLVDGTFQVPNLANFWTQGNSYTALNPLDGNWHMFTITYDSNRVMDVYIDGVRDPSQAAVGGPSFTDLYGNPGYGPDLALTNYYYTSNSYPAVGVPNPPPNGYVRWVWNNIFKTGSTVFGGFKRGPITGGFSMQIDDIAFWNRQLDTNEIMFVYTNGLPNIPLIRPLIINSFTADFAEVGQGDFVTLRWNITGATTNTGSGGIEISGVGDLSSAGLIGSVNVPVNGDQTFTLTARNGVAPDETAMVSVKAFPGVDSQWHLVQRFDGVFSDTFNSPAGGISGNGWVSSEGNFSTTFDKWNVYTITNSGAENKVLTPRTGYNPNAGSPTGFESAGALSFGRLGSLTMSPGETNTLFFRFSLQETLTGIESVFSDMSFSVGLSDYGFLGPGIGGTGGGVGPYFTISRITSFVGGPFDLTAPDRVDPASGNPGGNYSYIASVDSDGIQTNVNYLVWMDIWNRNTRAEEDPLNPGITNTVEQAQYSVWLQKQGEPARTLLVTNFHGNRDYVNYNPVNDNPTPFLDKVFFDIDAQSLINGSPGAYIATNMIAIDDIYLSKSGVNATIPRLFDITSIVKGSSSVTLTWNSLGSLFGTNTYTILRKTSLADAQWTPLATIPSGGTTTTYTDNTIGANSSAYYRIAWP